jgi:alcohol dehydrogenase class IV
VITQYWSFPTRILYGPSAINQLGVEVAALGAKRVLVVTDRGVVDAGLVTQVGEALGEKSVGYVVFDGISSNPTEPELTAAVEAWKASNAEAIVAVGGGSPLDIGKLVRLLATHEGPIAKYDDATGGDKLITADVPPMVAVPTTAGTGSEVGRSGVVTVDATNKKTVVFHPKLMPDVAILDPELTVSLPAKITAATGFDALTHCIEAYCAKGDHPMCDAIALEGVRLVARHLEKAVKDGADLRARGAMMQAAMMGAVAFQKGLGACHSLAHPLSAEHDLHHGLANAVCLPAVLDFNRAAIQPRIAEIARMLGVRGDAEETLAFECAGAVRALRRKVGLPEGLAACGVPEDGLPGLARLAIEDACHQLNARTCTEEDMLTLYRASM